MQNIKTKSGNLGEIIYTNGELRLFGETKDTRLFQGASVSSPQERIAALIQETTVNNNGDSSRQDYNSIRTGSKWG